MVKNARCATRIRNKVSEAFSDRKFYLKHKLSTASMLSSTGKVIMIIYLSKTADWQSKACVSNKIYDQRTLQKLYFVKHGIELNWNYETIIMLY